MIKNTFSAILFSTVFSVVSLYPSTQTLGAAAGFDSDLAPRVQVPAGRNIPVDGNYLYKESDMGRLISTLMTPDTSVFELRNAFREADARDIRDPRAADRLRNAPAGLIHVNAQESDPAIRCFRFGNQFVLRSFARGTDEGRDVFSEPLHAFYNRTDFNVVGASPTDILMPYVKTQAPSLVGHWTLIRIQNLEKNIRVTHYDSARSNNKLPKETLDILREFYGLPVIEATENPLVQTDGSSCGVAAFNTLETLLRKNALSHNKRLDDGAPDLRRSQRFALLQSRTDLEPKLNAIAALQENVSASGMSVQQYLARGALTKMEQTARNALNLRAEITGVSLEDFFTDYAPSAPAAPGASASKSSSSASAASSAASSASAPRRRAAAPVVSLPSSAAAAQAQMDADARLAHQLFAAEVQARPAAAAAAEAQVDTNARLAHQLFAAEVQAQMDTDARLAHQLFAAEVQARPEAAAAAAAQAQMDADARLARQLLAAEVPGLPVPSAAALAPAPSLATATQRRAQLKAQQEADKKAQKQAAQEAALHKKLVAQAAAARVKAANDVLKRALKAPRKP